MRVVWSSIGGGWSDSPRVLHEALVRRGDPLEHVWLAAADRTDQFPAGTVTVERGTPEARAALESADVVVSSDHVDQDWDKRPGTFYLQTWHGTPLKRIHNDVLWAPEGRLARLDHDVARWDALISPNRASTPLLRNAFGFRGPVHEVGYPRNDVLVGPDAGRRRAEVRARLGIADGVTAVLYAPTWRDQAVFSGEGAAASAPLDIPAVAGALGDRFVLLVRLHSLVQAQLDPVPSGSYRDVSGHPDIADLHLASDVLVTDYSSAMVDFAATGKPVVLHVPDLADYTGRVRGLYVDLPEVAPGPLLEDTGQVVAALRDLDGVRRASAERAARFRATYCHLDDGSATDRVLGEVLDPVLTTTPTPDAAPAPGAPSVGAARDLS